MVNVKVVIVVIQLVLELTPVQVIQARPTGSRVSITVRESKKRVHNKSGEDRWAFDRELGFHL